MSLRYSENQELNAVRTTRYLYRLREDAREDLRKHVTKCLLCRIDSSRCTEAVDLLRALQKKARAYEVYVSQQGRD